MKIAATKMTTRQATAKPRIQQTDSLAGSAPPYEKRSHWIFNPDRTTEKKLIEDMVTYLLDDVHTTDSAILRFIYREWPLLTSSMNTKTTVNQVKTRLHDMGVRYIYRTQDNDWMFWDDYTETGILDMSAPPETAKPHAQDSITDIQHTPTSVPRITTPTSLRKTGEATIASAPSFTPTTDIPAPSENQLTQFDVAMGQPDNESDESEEKYHGDILPNAWRTENVSPMSTASNLKTPHRDSTVTRPLLDTKPPGHVRQTQLTDSGGFTRVPPRKRKEKDVDEDTLDTPRAESATSTTNKQNNVDIVDLTTPERLHDFDILKKKLHQPPLSTPDIDTVHDILNDRVRLALLEIDRREAVFVSNAKQFEATQRQLAQQQSDDRLKILQKMVQQEKLLKRWTVSLVEREDTLDDLETSAHNAHAEFQRQAADDTMDQGQQTLRAWADVQVEKLKDTLLDNETAHKTRLKDYCTDQLQQLESTLDGWTEHARGIHQRLIVRFRSKNLKKTFAEVNQEQEEHHVTTEIRVEDDSDADDDLEDTPAVRPSTPSRWQQARDMAQRHQAPPVLQTSHERYEAA